MSAKSKHADTLADLDGLITEFRELIQILRPLAERALNTPHFWEPSKQPRGDRNTLEAQAIVLLTTLERPSIAGIARELGVHRNTLRGWPHFSQACVKMWGSSQKRAPRRGYITRDGGADCGVPACAAGKDDSE